MSEVFLECIIECLKMSPLIFLTYVIIEVVERKVGFAKNGKFLSGKCAPVFGALAGIFPQCGVSVMAAKLFSKSLISVGALFAVFIATSDEAISILIASGKWQALIMLIVSKFLSAVLVGMFINLIFSPKKNQQEYSEGEFSHEEICAHCHDHVEEKPQNDKYLCVKRYILVPLLHAMQTFLFIFAVSFVFGVLFGEEGIIGADKFEAYLSKSTYFEPFLCSLIGLIPSCASSAILSSAYINGAISFGGMFSGLCVNAGVGLAVLLKDIKNLKRNLLLLFALYVISSLLGIGVGFIATLLEI